MNPRTFVVVSHLLVLMLLIGPCVVPALVDPPLNTVSSDTVSLPDTESLDALVVRICLLSLVAVIVVGVLSAVIYHNNLIYLIAFNSVCVDKPPLLPLA